MQSNSSAALIPTTLGAERWDAFVAAHRQGHFLQSHAWGELKAAFGWKPVRLALEREGQICAAAQILFRQLPLLAIAYIPRGPVVDWQDEPCVAVLFREIDRIARAHRAIFLKISPPLPDQPPNHRKLHALGFEPASNIQPRTTLVVDLDADEEALMADMKKNTRYNVRLASRRGVTVRRGEDPEAVALFYELLLETAERQDFGIHTLDYYQEVYRLFNQAGRGILLFAEREGQVLATRWSVCFADEGANLYSATRSEGRRHKAAELLQWEVIRWGRQRGCRRYDLWGIPDQIKPNDEESLEKAREDPLWGVYRFKEGFGGEVVRFVGAYDRVHRPWLYRLYRRFGV